MGWLDRLFTTDPGPKRVEARRTTLAAPYVVVAPRLGIWNLLGPAARAAMNEDRAELSPLFAATEVGAEGPPPCDVLLAYCTVEVDGSLAGTPLSLRQAIARSGATIVLLASENPPEHYIAASQRPGKGKANLVMTLDRKGDAFPAFFRALFEDMQRGKTMPMAWVKLAQGAAPEQARCPSTICVMEAGHVAFGG